MRVPDIGSPQLLAEMRRLERTGEAKSSSLPTHNSQKRKLAQNFGKKEEDAKMQRELMTQYMISLATQPTEEEMEARAKAAGASIPYLVHNELVDLLSDQQTASWASRLGQDGTGKAAYLTACHHVGVKPLSAVMDRIIRQSLDLHSYGLGAPYAPTLAALMTENRHITHLDVSDNNLGDKAGAALIEALTGSPTLKKLCLSKTKLGSRALAALGSMMSKNNTLEVFAISNNQLGDALVEQLAQALMLNRATSLREIDISGNALTTRANMTDLFGALRTVTKLAISWNCITLGEKAVLALDEASVNDLSLSFSAISNKSGRSLCGILQGTHNITSLDLSHNSLTAEFGLALAPILGVDDHIGSLNLSFNRLGLPATLALVESLRTNTSLRYLGIRETGIILQDLRNSYGITPEMLEKLEINAGAERDENEGSAKKGTQSLKLWNENDLQKVDQLPRLKPSQWQVPAKQGDVTLLEPGDIVAGLRRVIEAMLKERRENWAEELGLLHEVVVDMA